MVSEEYSDLEGPLTREQYERAIRPQETIAALVALCEDLLEKYCYAQSTLARDYSGVPHVMLEELERESTEYRERLAKAGAREVGGGEG